MLNLIIISAISFYTEPTSETNYVHILADSRHFLMFLCFIDGQVDSAANVQPEKVEDIWNLRGILNTSWHRVQVQVGHSNL